MLTALITGIVGLISVIWIATSVLDRSPQEIATLIMATLVTGLISSTLVLTAARYHWIKRFILGRSIRMWAWVLFLYFGPLYLVSPWLFQWRELLWLALPLALVSGITIQVFGPIQDRITHHYQKKS